ncbi:hypothetical protein GDO86_020542 [Hymenochirus boettgeri]|uniref:protein-arginine deiminase n=1 Tax=Hymenochirus boettgeri TaxID=247094 RepID=A0A8T2IKN1_9PIPI|nr:hypothetical protein GDO86_020542 [Hymenochirus boettgeri]
MYNIIIILCTKSLHTTPRTSLHLQVKVSYYRSNSSSAVGNAILYLTIISVSLDVDVNRVGAVSRGVGDKGNWSWGLEGTGAILLVNCDRDRQDSNIMDSHDVSLPNDADLKDMSPMVLTAAGPDKVFNDHQIILHISRRDATKLRVYCKSKNSYVLGGDKVSYRVERGNKDQTEFYVEGLDFPDVDFNGLVFVNLSFERIYDKMEIFSEKVAFRLTPWIMTPNTQKPLEVYVCSVRDNTKFLKELTEVVKKAKCRLNVCLEVENRGDRWIQDEMEFGYIEAPHKQFPVVLDSPRNRQLDVVPFKKILGPDFGYVTREPKDEEEVDSLDAFGNLEVSPPVTVKGKQYPLGRILFGGSLGVSDQSPCPPRAMNKVVTGFLRAQLVQSPVELYSDWLSVGHIDEFMSFVPAPDKKGFRLLLASPVTCLELFRQKQKEGYGDAVLLEGLVEKPFNIDQILSNEKLLKDSAYTQECVDLNREVMKEELGLSEDDIIDIPVLYTLHSRKAEAFFPDMVNMLVLGKFLAIPKPFGPIIKGKCCLEEKVCSLLEPLGLNCNFIDDFAPYHLALGEVHCGSNVIRKPFSAKWWQIMP